MELEPSYGSWIRKQVRNIFSRYDVVVGFNAETNCPSSTKETRLSSSYNANMSGSLNASSSEKNVPLLEDMAFQLRAFIGEILGQTETLIRRSRIASVGTTGMPTSV